MVKIKSFFKYLFVLALLVLLGIFVVRFDKMYRRIRSIDRLVKGIDRRTAVKNDILYFYGVKFYVPNFTDESVQKSLVDNGNFCELDILNDLDKYIPDNAVILDVGSNVGNHTVYWSVKRHAKKVFAFEPVASTFSILKKNIELNKMQDFVLAFNVALSDTDENVKFVRFNPSSPDITQVAHSNDGDVKACRLDSIDLGVDHIDFVKIDVEGFEYEVLLGAKETFQKLSPKYIFIEIFEHTPTSKQTFQLIKDMGFILVKSYEGSNYLFANKNVLNK